MIEAVNSVLSNAPIARAVADQQSVATSFAANPDRVQVVAQAPYISPYIHVDVNFDKAVLQIRDSETGDVVRTIPTEGQMEAYRRAQSTQSLALNRAPQQREETPSEAVRDVAPAQTRAPAQSSAPTPSSTPVSPQGTPIQAAAAPVAATQVSVNTQA